MTPAMWRTMVRRMELEMWRKGMVLGSADKRAILDYLERNAGEH